MLERFKPIKTPEAILSQEVRRLSRLPEDRSRIAGMHVLYIPGDSQIPYAETTGLPKGEIVVSNAMGDREAYRYRSLGKNVTALVNPENGEEVLRELSGKEATTHAELLSGFGLPVEKPDKVNILHSGIAWHAQDFSRMINYGAKMGIKDIVNSEGFAFPGYQGMLRDKPTVAYNIQKTHQRGPLIILNTDSDSTGITVAYAQKSTVYRVKSEGYDTTSTTDTFYSIEYSNLDLDPRVIKRLQDSPSPELLPLASVRLRSSQYLPKPNEKWKTKEDKGLPNPIHALKKQLYIARLSTSSKSFGEKLEELKQAAQNEELNPNLAKYAKYEFAS